MAFRPVLPVFGVEVQSRLDPPGLERRTSLPARQRSRLVLNGSEDAESSRRVGTPLRGTGDTPCCCPISRLE
jgi:hypothetical protein